MFHHAISCSRKHPALFARNTLATDARPRARKVEAASCRFSFAAKRQDAASTLIRLSCLVSFVTFFALQPSLSAATATAPAPLAEQRIDTDAGHPLDQPEANAVAPVPAVAPAKTKSGNEWIIAPIPSYNPSQGYQLLGVAQYVFHPKNEPADTPPSIIGLSAFYTQENSKGAVVAYMGHVKNDLWRPAFGGGYIDFHYNYYGNGTAAAELGEAIPVQQRGAMLFGRLMYRVYEHLYVGLGAFANETKINIGATLPPDIAVPDKVTQYVIGPAVQWDSRDNQFFPTRGTLANLRLSYAGGEYSYGKFSIDWNKYLSFDALPGAVIALRAAARYSGDNAPFFGLSQFGSQNDLRGYIAGKYRDHALVATQAEWRQSLSKRWIVAVFAGIGEVAPNFGSLRTDDLLASAGAGIRYRLGKKNPVHLRLDWAYGKDGDAWYFSVGEAY